MKFLSDYSAPEQAALRTEICPEATDDQINYFLRVCQARSIDPFSGLLYMQRRFNSKTNKWKCSVQPTVDGSRAAASRTGFYAGSDEPEFDTEDAQFPNWCRVTVYRMIKSERCAFTAKCRWREFVPAPPNDFQWKAKPYHMLSKCFDEKTQVLTEAGFKYFADVEHEKIMQVTPLGLEPVAATPFAQDYADDMIQYDSDDVNFCVTPNHDMITTAGRIEAATMYDLSRAAPSFYIPRIPPQDSSPGLGLEQRQIELAACYLADGSTVSGQSFRVGVSRPHKVEMIRAWALHRRETVGNKAGAIAVGHSGREIVTRNAQTKFSFPMEAMGGLGIPGKRLCAKAVAAMNSQEARWFINAYARFDGNAGSGGGSVRTLRIYTADQQYVGILEYLAVKGGYSVARKDRKASDIGRKNGFVLSLSTRNEIPIVRRGRFHLYEKPQTTTRKPRSLETVKNESGKVWCVTVPSGIIVVRRDGFSMLCGNCTEVQALRKAFPESVAATGEDDYEDEIESTQAAPDAAQAEKARLAVEWDNACKAFAAFDKKASDLLAYIGDKTGTLMTQDLLVSDHIEILRTWYEELHRDK